VLQSIAMKPFAMSFIRNDAHTVFFLLIPFLTAQTATEVEITAEPSHILRLKTSMCASSRSRFPAHAATLMHRHRPRLCLRHARRCAPLQ